MKMKRKLEDFGTRSAAENKILAELDSGEDIVLLDGFPPDVLGDYDVRSEFIRYLALGGCEACRLHEKGLRVWRARIIGDLDLEGCEAPRDLALIECRFEGRVVLQSSKLQNLFLNDSFLSMGLDADRLDARRNVVLRGVEAKKEVRLVGAKLGGNLDCGGARFNAMKYEESGQTSTAFNATRVECQGDANFGSVVSNGELCLLGAKLRGNLNFDSAQLSAWSLDGNSSNFIAASIDQLKVDGNVSFAKTVTFGQVRLLGAELGADLACVGAKFSATQDGQTGDNIIAFWADGMVTTGSVFLRGLEAQGSVFMLGAQLGGGLEVDGAIFNTIQGGNLPPNEDVFSGEGMKVQGFFFLRNGAEFNGSVSFAGASVGGLIDSPMCWPEGPEQMNLDRFRYDAILGDGPVDAKTRIAWLGKLYHGDGFRPQPYEQLAKVLREMGHREDARVVLIEKERLQRAAANPPWWRRVWNWVMQESAGYGYRPSLSLRYLALLLLVGTYVFGAADYFGAVKPNSARVWHLDKWKDCAGKEFSQSACYLASDKGKSYPAFNPIIYSVDTLLPIVDLEMQGAWIPDDRAGLWGIGARVYLWLHIALGWFFSLLAVAGFSGLIKPE